MNASIRKFLKEEDGVTALEYGLLAAVIAGILIAVGNAQIKSFFETLFSNLSALATKASGATPPAGGN
ncbi:Flp family type IVb pilin [Stenotrophomonas geniculata]|jgi:pilus assembly protein Flp/PilA|uniref:Flp family type IVb pilin n=1 Tax=Stenotrophomonas geniculata TaxID=86188 RepID=UPI00066B225E|nr:Flp family type IVb pilin [Stenotrophomonas geniculata]KPG79377.1 pilin [Stenotrophomonas maltophilia]MBA0241396.1 Flp family type IVb pilin [Stenotrophomonas maltophilia]MBA0246014.1 Flp family type IVb pilin [Stenotrophomonas maltophilia]MBA0305238.1 Flp family type IVb pilin [Stenotrophomonas maltophilia]MBA0437963.1 Flp family type IVb pilin [Stenotrophomonas maltophilia]